MRFIDDGINLPDELLWAHDEGRVVFICGAGVSRAKAGLPDFNALTKTVLDGLGADESEDAFQLYRAFQAAETASGIKRFFSADDVFHLLEQSFTRDDIGFQVARALAPGPNVDLGAHRTLLALSRRNSGAVRLVTTNFDRLFEQCDRKLATATRSNLPDLGAGPADWGIVHLHGCVDRAYSGPTEDGFVLSSGSFGDAYLAMGWAREFVKAVLAKYVVVFVGYSADDPPIRYLLQGLQQSNGASNETYAFQSCSDEAAAGAWKEKGVKPLLYETRAGCGHRALWETLEHWSTRARDPGRWRDRVLVRARRGPRELAPHERGMVAHIVSDVEGAEAFARKQPPLPAEWLCVFDPHIRYGEPNPRAGATGSGPVVDPFDWYHLDSDPSPCPTQAQPDRPGRVPEQAWSALDPSLADCRTISPDQVAQVRGRAGVAPPRLPDRIAHLAGWIAWVSEHPAAAWWAGGQDAIHEVILDGIRVALRRPPSKSERPAVRKAWQAYLDYADLKRAWHEGLLDLRVRETGWSEAVADEYVACFAPSLSLDAIGRGPVPPPTDRELTNSHLVSVSVEYEDQVLGIGVPDDYLQNLVPKLRVQLERAETLENKYSTSPLVCSIEPDDKLEEDASSFRSWKLSGRVITFAWLFRRLAQRSPALALAELRTWPVQSGVFARIRTWALGNLTFAPTVEYAEALLALDRTRFWSFRGQRDLLLGLSKRWSAIDRPRRRRLERRLRAGPPRPRGTGREEHAERAAHEILMRLHWLHRQGCDFSFDLDAITEKLCAAVPRWRPSYADRAADSRDARSGRVRTDTDYRSIESLPPEDILRHLDLQEHGPRDPFVRRDPFAGLSEHQPERAIQALAQGYARGRFGETYWNTFLRSDRRTNNFPELTATVLEALLDLSDGDFAQIALPASDWFGRAATASMFNSEPRCKALWAKFMRVLGRQGETNRPAAIRPDAPPGRTRDWSTEAGRSPAGILTRLAVKTFRNHRSAGGRAARFGRLEELLALPGDPRRHALAVIAGQLDDWFAIDTEWTKRHVFTVLDERTDTELDREAMWAGFFLSPRRPTPALFARLKPHFLALTRRATGPGDRQSIILAETLVAGWRNTRAGDRIVSSKHMRNAIVDAHENFRHSLIWGLRERFGDEDERDAGQVVNFLSCAWPKQQRIRTPETSALLCQLAFSRTTDFPEVAGAVARLVTKIDKEHGAFVPLYDLEETAAGGHPWAVLDLLHAFLPDRRKCWPDGAEAAMRFLRGRSSSIQKDPKFVELDGRT